MYSVYDFICWALTKVDPNTILKSAEFPIPQEECGTEPWHYLYGTVKVHTTKFWLNERYENYYKDKGYTREEFDAITANWSPEDWATDCQGLLDAWMTYEAGEKTDINANMNYVNWCTDKGAIAEIDRPYVIGEAVFVKNKNSNKMGHVGWVCGFLPSGEALVVEARGLRYGVVVTRLTAREWTHRGLMTAVFDYTPPQTFLPEPIPFKLVRPHLTGEIYARMQSLLNDAGYYADDEHPTLLAVDGSWGPLSQAVFEKLLKLNNPQPPVVDVFPMSEGGYIITVTKDIK